MLKKIRRVLSRGPGLIRAFWFAGSAHAARLRPVPVEPSVPEDPSVPRPLALLGSSASEVFDYIFGNEPLYHPLWASGWSARVLSYPSEEGFVTHVVRDLPRNTTILLNFGINDINFNLRYKMRGERFYDLTGFLDETAEGIIKTWKLLNRLGFRHVHAVFPSPVVALPPEYWHRYKLPVLPLVMLGQMYRDLAVKTAAGGVPVIDLTADLIISDEKPILQPRFTREEDDHHASYIATQQIVWEGISHLPGLPPRRETFLTEHYPHVPYMIRDWRDSDVVRPRTTR